MTSSSRRLPNSSAGTYCYSLAVVVVVVGDGCVVVAVAGVGGSVVVVVDGGADSKPTSAAAGWVTCVWSGSRARPGRRSSDVVALAAAVSAVAGVPVAWNTDWPTTRTAVCRCSAIRPPVGSANGKPST